MWRSTAFSFLDLSSTVASAKLCSPGHYEGWTRVLAPWVTTRTGGAATAWKEGSKA